MSRMTTTVRRVLIVSAAMGEGHNATGKALAEAVDQLWPQAQVRWQDTLDAMGPGVGPLFRWIYRTNVEQTPWLYEFFYDSLWRHRWFARASKRFVGAWCGRRMRRLAVEFDPDLVLSTYPLGTAGLAWLREHGLMAAPIGAWISDFAPHPFWVYDGIERNLVMHPVAVPLARECAPQAQVAVSAPPVRRAIGPSDRGRAREQLGYPMDAFIPLVACGALGFGDLAATTESLLAADPRVTPVVVCGRNEQAHNGVQRLADVEPRVRVLGWTDQMPELLAACDVVVTNAGGATGLEALAAGRPVLMAEPIAAHGKANAALMAQAELAEVCTTPSELTQAMRRLATHPAELAHLAAAARGHAEHGKLTDAVAELATVTPRAAGPSAAPVRCAQPVRAQDALFAHIETARTPQHAGAVLVFDPKPDGTPVTVADAEYLLQAAPRLGSRLSRGRGHRLRWQPADQQRPGVLVEHVVTATALGEHELDKAIEESMDDFYSRGPDPSVCGTAARLVTGTDGGRSALLIAVHHSFGDGLAMINELVTQARGYPPRASIPDGRGSGGRGAQRPARQLGSVTRGLWALARTGVAPRSGLQAPGSRRDQPQERHHSWLRLDGDPLRSNARQAGVSTSELMLAVLAEALHRELGEQAPQHVRTMVPVSVRTDRSQRAPGNYTGGVRVDLPTAAMPLARRVEATRVALRAELNSGAVHAAHEVVRVLGVLPPVLHRWLARRFYCGTWFSMIASVLRGARSPVELRGARIATVYPVLSLAPGVDLAVGSITWGEEITLGVTAGPWNHRLADGLVTRAHEVAAELSGTVDDAWAAGSGGRR